MKNRITQSERLNCEIWIRDSNFPSSSFVLYVHFSPQDLASSRNNSKICEVNRVRKNVESSWKCFNLKTKIQGFESCWIYRECFKVIELNPINSYFSFSVGMTFIWNLSAGKFCNSQICHIIKALCDILLFY